ncbi:MAG: hypothetical protein HYT37_03960 [Candidatus Sungbacteria bacterium]|nr:hypothetical protein [Candidatus Sungbacteria bacterium]
MWKNLSLFAVQFFVMLSPVSVAYAEEEYPNPIGFTDIPSFILYLINALIVIVIPIAILLVVYIGFKFVASSARGNMKGVEEARKTLLWTLIGTAVIVGAAALAYGFVNFVKTL